MKNTRTEHLDFIIEDMLALGMAQFLMMVLNQDKLNRVLYTYYIQLGILLAVITLSVALMIGGYSNVLHRKYLKKMITVSRQVTITSTVEVICLFVFQLNGFFSRVILFAISVLGVLLIYGEHLLMERFLKRKYQKIKYARTIMTIATKQQAEVLIGRLSTGDFSVFHIRGLAVTDRNVKGERVQRITVSCSMGEATDYITGHIVDGILLSIPDDPQQESELANQSLSIGMVVHVYIGWFLQDIPRKALGKICGINVVTYYSRGILPRSLFCKRMLDTVGSLMGVVMIFEVGLVVGPIIYMKSPSPILFSQIRVGKNGRKFGLYKSRSMVMDAEQQKESLMARNKIRGNIFEIDDGPRIIPGIGRFIRRTNLNEFPQFFNTLKGDMSLVGTRPPTVNECESYSFAYKKRLAIEPGVTGLWQVSGRSDITDFEQVVRLDSRYIDQWDLEMDLKTTFRTILVVLERKGSV